MREGGDKKRTASERGDFSRDANGAIPIWAVGSDLQVVDDIAAGAPEIFREGLAHFGVLTQNEEAINFLAQSEFLRRAQHSLRFDAADFSHLDRQRRFSAF